MMRGTVLAAVVAAIPFMSQAADEFIIVQSTTSTQNSGLYDAILPRFTQSSGIEVRVVAVGTGQALKNAANCDGDVLLVHAKEAEEQFIADGYGLQRHRVMYNDFVIVGPANGPVDLKNTTTAAEALRAIAQSQTPFASRGDDSGTHKKEQALWSSTDLDPSDQSGTWYRETGSGMGATLNIAVGMDAYALTDRATWLAFENKQNHKIQFEGDPALFNQYGVTLVNPAHCTKVKIEAGAEFINWLLTDGQDAIARHTKDGEQLFFPNAR